MRSTPGRALAGAATAWLRTRAPDADHRAGRAFTLAQVVGSGLLTVWLHRFTSSVYAVRWASPDALPDNVLADLGVNALVALLDPLMLVALGALLAFSLAARASRLALRRPPERVRPSLPGRLSPPSRPVRPVARETGTIPT